MFNKKIAVIAVCASLVFSASAMAKKQSIVFWQSWGGDLGFGGGMKALVKAFNESQKNVEVKMVTVNPLEEKLLIAMAGGSCPDVSMFDRFMLSQWGNVNGFISLDPYFKRDKITASQYMKACWNEAKINGVMQAMPFNTDVRLLFYNKALFRKYGLNPETPPKTWQELEDMSMKVTKKLSESTLETAGFIPYMNQGWPYLYLFQNGVQFFNDDNTKVTMNSPAAVDALEWEASMVERQGGFSIVNKFAGTGPWEKGKLGGLIEGDWAINDFQKRAKNLEFGVAFPPYSKVKTTWSGGHSLVIPKLSKHKDAAWQFIKFVGSKEGQLIFARAAYTIPANRAAAAEMSKAVGMDKRWAYAVDQLDDSMFRPQSLVALDMWNELNDASNLVIQRKVTAKAALDNAVKRLQLSFDKKRSRKR